MKKFKLLPIVAFAMLLGSCKKDTLNIEEQIPTSSILKKSNAEQVKYAQENLTKVVSGLAKLAQNEEFVNLVHTEAAKKFDGEYEVLIETLKKDPHWGTLLNTPEINEGLNAFKNLEGQNYFPQIYIPKMQHDEETNANRGNNLVGDITDIKFVPFGGELPTDNVTYPGGNYPTVKIGANNTLESAGVVNELTANANEVWVVSLNETVNSLMQLPSDPCGVNPTDGEPCPGSGGGSGGGGGTGGGTGVDVDPAEFSRNNHPDMGTHNPLNCRINKMKITLHNERWVSGGSEVSIRARLNTINGRLYGGTSGVASPYSSDQYSNYLGKLIRKFSRSEINNQDLITFNYTLQTLWPSNVPSTDPVYFDYVIFEKDNWPTGCNNGVRQDYTGFPYFLTDSYTQYYRSSDAYYFLGSITNNLPLVKNGYYYNPNFSKLAYYYNDNLNEIGSQSASIFYIQGY